MLVHDRLSSGVFSDEDEDMEVELSLSVEEQLQRALDQLRDAVISAHSKEKLPSEGGLSPYLYITTTISTFHTLGVLFPLYVMFQLMLTVQCNIQTIDTVLVYHS